MPSEPMAEETILVAAANILRQRAVEALRDFHVHLRDDDFVERFAQRILSTQACIRAASVIDDALREMATEALTRTEGERP